MTFDLDLDCQEFEYDLVARRQCFDGIMYRFKFKNGRGASVIKFEGSRGWRNNLWELSVLKYYASGYYRIDYDTEITGGVLGYQTSAEILDVLERIKALP